LPPFYDQINLFLGILTNNNPFAMKWLITIIESITPILIFVILRMFVDTEIAVLSSIIYAISPTIINYSVNAWNPNMLPFFVTLGLLSWLKYLKLKKPKWILIGSISTVIAINLHYQAVVIMPFVMILFIYSILNRKKDWYWWFYGLILGLLILSPYIWAEFHNNFANTREMYVFFTREHSHFYDRISKPMFIWKFIPAFFEKVLIGVQKNYWLGRLVLFLGGIVLFIKSFKDKNIRWLSIYFLTIFLMLRVYKGDKLDYYLMTLFSFPAIIIAFILDKWRKLSIFLILFLVYFDAIFYLHNSSFDNYLKVQNQFKTLNTLVGRNKVKLLFDNPDQINVFAYGLKHFAKFEITNEKKNILELCDNKNHCVWDKIPRCIDNRGYTFMSLLKNDQSYEEFIVNNNKLSVLNKFDQNIYTINYKPYRYNGDHGSDLLIKNIYDW